MKTWKHTVEITGKGICEVREMTDFECSRALKKKINWAPKSCGFVNLFKNDEFVGWCGVFYAQKHVTIQK